MTTNFQRYLSDSSESARGGFAITKSDTTVFTTPTRAIWVGGAGNVVVTHIDGTVVPYNGVPAGFLLPVRCTKVMNATTATNLTGMY